MNFAQMCKLGIMEAVTKLVAEEYGRNDVQGVQSYIVMALTMLTAMGIIALILAVVFKV